MRRRYLAGCAATILVLTIRIIAERHWGASLPLITLYPAVLLAAWLGGLGPGLLSCFVCTLAGSYLDILPIYSFSFLHYGNLAALMLFFVIGAMMVIVIDARAKAEARLRAVQQVIDAIIPYSTMEELLRRLVIQVRAVLKSDVATAWLIQEDSAQLKSIASVGYPGDSQGLFIPRGRGVVGRIAGSQAGFVLKRLNNSEANDRSIHPSARSAAGVPLKLGDRLIGVLDIWCKAPRKFTANDLVILRLISERAAIAVERSHLSEAERNARKAAESADRMKDTFLAMVSHDLRSPLQAILGAIQVLKKSPLPGEGAQFLEVIERNARTQTRLVQDLIDVSQTSAGRLTLDMHPQSIRSIVEFTLQSMQPRFAEKRLHVESRTRGTEKTLLMDADRVQQIVTNLLSNAAKFTQPEGVILVDLDERKDDEIELTVTDTGIGIDPAFLPNVFLPFRQEHSSAHRDGLGLGLAIVKKLVDLHGGSIEASSAGAGTGSTFVLKLPVNRSVEMHKAKINT